KHLERARIERLLAAGASIKGTARKFAINYHALRRHWVNHVSADARAAYIAGTGATKDQLEEIVADESLALIDHYRIARGALYKGFGAEAEIGDCNALAMLWARLAMQQRAAVAKADPKRKRCAVYTRKSSEEGLEQGFNSLVAQREACEAYIRSQQHE